MSGLRGSIRINDRVGGGMCHSVWLYVRRCNHPIQAEATDLGVNKSILEKRWRRVCCSRVIMCERWCGLRSNIPRGP
jgi:hypothetical protein